MIILLVTVFVGLLLYVYELKYRKKHPADIPDEEAKELLTLLGMPFVKE